jgi:hypothetical protein
MTIGTSRSNFGGLRGAYGEAVEELPYNYDTLDAQSGWTTDPTRPSPLSETSAATEEAEAYIQGQRLKERAKKGGGFMAAAKGLWEAPGVGPLKESVKASAKEWAKMYKEGQQEDLDRSDRASAMMDRTPTNLYGQARAGVKMPRINYSRMPGRTRPLSVPNVPQPKPQPPYNLLRTDYGFPMTQKMTPSERLKDKAKGMR